MEGLVILYYFVRYIIGLIVFCYVILKLIKPNNRITYFQNRTNYFYRPKPQFKRFTGYHQPNPYTTRQYNDTTGFQEPPMYPYKSKNILTPTEQQFYNVLKRKCDYNNLIICPKVRLEDFVDLTTTENVLKYRGYIKSRHIDFILCDNNMNIIAGIEVDDASHNTPERRKIDDFKSRLFRTINIPLHRVPVGLVNFEDATDGILRAYHLFH